MDLQAPKEHGAWAMLYTPFVLGAAAARRMSWQLLVLLAAVTLLFFARQSLVLYLRSARRNAPGAMHARRAGIQVAGAAVCGAVLAAQPGLRALVWFGAAAGLLLALQWLQLRRRDQRSITAEIAAIAGLTATAPTAYGVALQHFTATAAWLWAISALYFGSSVFFVKLRVADIAVRRAAEQRRLRWAAGVYHTVAAAGVAAAVAAPQFRWWLVLGFVPAFARTLVAMVRRQTDIDLRRIGVLEIFYSLAFLAAAASAVRQPAQP